MLPPSTYARKREEALWLRVYRIEAHAKQDGKCAYCRSLLRRGAATADHVVAVAKHGRTSADNIKAACKPCNSAKGARSEKAFKRAIAQRPPIEAPMSVWRAWMRLTLSKRTEVAERRILACAGLRSSSTCDSPPLAHLTEHG